LTVLGAAMGSRAIVIVPFDVTISAVYRVAGSMHIGGGPSNFWRFGLDPSAAGQSVAM
jgi:hypothetical protein